MRPRATFSRGALAPLVLAALAIGAAAPGRAAKLPAPGSYALARIQRAPDAALLDADGRGLRLSEATRGAVTALAFFYSHCQDPLGCPVAWSTFEAVRNAASDDPLLKRRLRLVFVSLDPERDSSSVLKLLRDSEGADSSVPWSFLTASSQDALAPLLQSMGQDVALDVGPKGAKTGALNHMLKVFLIDPDGWTREIYTVAFLTPENLLNDARTLALEFPHADNEPRAR
jgi:cytochrome oxidase Cu insertion factor (SCO1/SenC/PrrC family)